MYPVKREIGLLTFGLLRNKQKCVSNINVFKECFGSDVLWLRSKVIKQKNFSVIPVKTGNQQFQKWIPVFTGMTILNFKTDFLKRIFGKTKKGKI